MKIYECAKCGRWESAMFTAYGDKEVKFCPYCGSDQHLYQIKSGKREEEHKKKRKEGGSNDTENYKS